LRTFAVAYFFLCGAMQASEKRLCFWEAAQQGDLARVTQLLTPVSTSHCFERVAKQALSIAVRNDHVLLVRALLALKALAGGSEGHVNMPPLRLAAAYGCEASANVLLAAKAEVECTPRHNALSEACRRGHVGVIHCLLSAPGQSPLNLSEPLLYAAQHGHTAVCQMLCYVKANVNTYPGHLGHSSCALGAAVRFRHCETAQALLECKADGDFTGPLLSAAENEDTEMVRVLVQHKALVHCHESLGIAVAHRDVATARVLLEARAPVNVMQMCGDCVLSLAASHNDTAMVRLLLRCKASLNGKDWFGRTPAQYAVQTGAANALRLLLHAKAVLEDQAAKRAVKGTC